MDALITHASIAARENLWQTCQAFIDRMNIHSPETITRSDRVVQNAYDLIQEVCEIVGYKPDPSL